MHFPGSHLRLTLSAILPYEARTFLTVIPFGNIPRGRLAEFHSIIAKKRAFVKFLGKSRKKPSYPCISVDIGVKI